MKPTEMYIPIPLVALAGSALKGDSKLPRMPLPQVFVPYVIRNLYSIIHILDNMSVSI